MKKKITIIAFIIIGFNCNAQTQTEMNSNASEYYKEADKKMTILYKEIMSSLPKEDKQLLLEAQRNWVKFKESHCKTVEHGFKGGSLQPLVYYSCLLELTEERIKQLQKYKTN